MNLRVDLTFVHEQFDLMGWLAKHGEEATHAALDPVLDGLKEEGVSKFAAVGYCFGVRIGNTHLHLFWLDSDIHDFYV